jgi:hypothetical protein
MATIPQVSKQTVEMDEDGNYILPDDPSMPGWSVNVLVAEGKMEEAREELFRLIDEGVDSGPGIEVTPQYFDDMLAEVKRRAASRK